MGKLARTGCANSSAPLCTDFLPLVYEVGHPLNKEGLKFSGLPWGGVYEPGSMDENQKICIMISPSVSTEEIKIYQYVYGFINSSL